MCQVADNRNRITCGHFWCLCAATAHTPDNAVTIGKQFRETCTSEFTRTHKTLTLFKATGDEMTTTVYGKVRETVMKQEICANVDSLQYIHLLQLNE